MTAPLLQYAKAARARNWRLALMCTAFAIGTGGVAWSTRTESQTTAYTQIASEPLATRQNVQAKPNLMFILDNSGSMNWSYMPDLLGASSGTDDAPYGQWYAYRTVQCNGLAYDPTLTYSPPVDSSGAVFAASSFSSAWPDGYSKDSTQNLAQATNITTNNSPGVGTGTRTFAMTGSAYGASTFIIGDAVTVTTSASSSVSITGAITGWSSSTRNGTTTWTLTVEASESSGSSNTNTWTVTRTPTYFTYKSSGTQTAMGWTYDADGDEITGSTFYKECTSKIGSTPGSGVFTKVTVTSTSAEATNYANWYSYYRKRYLLMRTAMGRAISALDDKYRVGFSTISDAGVTDGAATAGSGTGYFRDVKDFNATQKTNFYSSLYGSQPNGSTPLRVALSKAGRYFGKKFSGQYDPMQYSCQRNYALLSTDGYWNGDKGVQLDGSEVGQQDGAEARPMLDDSTAVSTSVVTYTVPVTRSETSVQSRDLVWNRSVTTTSANLSLNIFSCFLQYPASTTTQSYVQYTETQTSVTPQSATKTYTVTTTTTNGVAGAPVTSVPTYSAWTNTGAATVTVTTTPDLGSPGTNSWTNGTTTSFCSSRAGSGAPVPGTSTTAFTSLSGAVITDSAEVAGTATSSSTATTATVGGTANTLADVAEYYYKTDLRTANCTSTSSGTSQDTCANIVRTTSSDPAAWQHMNTFTIGLGVSGTLPFDKNYLTQTSGSYVNLSKGTINWPSPGNVDSNSGAGGDARNVDDLWHAAVNGRGQYYSALNAGLLSEAINGVVSAVQEVSGSGSAASTSSLELVAGTNNQVFRASYTTQAWTGDLQAFALNGADASVGAMAWSAQATLDTAAPAARNIYFNSGGTLQGFSYDNLSSTQQGYFNNICNQSPVPLAQCATLSASDKAVANSGANLVNYLRGVRTYESQSTNSGNTVVGALYRKRAHVLGDIINGAPVHVGKPPFSYSDAGYADFVAAKATRKDVVYTAANDGMLHAFSSAAADGGTELWAFVPSAVMANMPKLANSNYGANHQYFVDGAPVMGDIKVGNTWKTILVGGLNSGGNSYYALDITNPAVPLLLWEFTDTNLGLTFGNPIITKRADGTWVVAFASGYNNADGKGHLYVLNANTGAQLLNIATTAGTATAPSGLAKINSWIDSGSDNTTKRFYGGDMLGNLWRFDIDSLYEPKLAALKLATFQININTPQPITTKPETVEISGRSVIVVGTGRYLSADDITDTTQQSLYGVKDPLTNTSWGDVRTNTNFVQQTFTPDSTDTSASVSNTAVDFAVKGGWFINLPHSKERIVTNLGLQLNTLAIASAIPNGDACASGGASWRYFLNVANGGVISTNPAGGLWSSNSLIVGMSWVKDSEGNVRIIFQGSNRDLKAEIPPTAPPAGAGSVRRTSWRELVD